MKNQKKIIINTDQSEPYKGLSDNWDNTLNKLKKYLNTSKSKN